MFDNKNIMVIYKNGNLVKICKSCQERYIPSEWHQKLFDYAKYIKIDAFSSLLDKIFFQDYEFGDKFVL